MRTRLDRKALVSDYLADTMPIHELVKKHGITRQWLYVILQKEGITKRLKPEFDSTEIDEDKVLREYAMDKSIRDVADLLGTSMTAVHTILRKHNAVGRKSRYRKLIPEWKEAYESGRSVYYIANLYNASYGTVKNRLKSAGVVLRPYTKAPVADEIKQRVIEMRENKIPQSEIAASNGISLGSVKNIIHNYLAANR